MSVTLSLRITSDKRKPGTKVPNIKEESLLPLIHRLRINGLGNCEYLDELEKAADLKTQLEILRKGLKLLKIQNDGENMDPAFLHMVVEILLSLELKSSLRNGIVRILKEFQGSESTRIIKTISDGFKTRFYAANNETTLILHIANTVCGCFDNFPLGLEAVKVCSEEAIIFFADSLTYCCKTLGEDERPAVNTEVCQCVHAVVRAVLHVLSLGTAVEVDKRRLHTSAKRLVASPLLPLDTRTNCGLLTVATSRDSWLTLLQEQSMSEDDLTSLCIYSGIIGYLTKEELTSGVDTDCTAKPPIQLIFDQILNIHKRNPLQPTVTLGVARGLVALTRVMTACSQEQVLQMLAPLLAYTWEHLEHVMDSVKHLAVSLLNNIVRLHSPEVDVYSSVLSAMGCLPVWGRARHTALSSLLGKVPVSQLVSRDEIQLMFHHLRCEVISSHGVNAFQELLRHHYNEISDKSEWKELWIRPLLHHLDQTPSVPLQQVLNKVLAISLDIIQFVLKLPDGEVSLGTVLLCLGLSHKAGLLDTTGPDGAKWRGVIGYDVLRSAMCHVDDQTRLSCLSLVVESPKKSEVFTAHELQLVADYVSHNLHWDSPASRQRNMALLGKFVSRFNDSHAGLRRRAVDSSTQLLLSYSQCKSRLEQCCVASLFPGAAYSRRVSALHLLTALRPAASPQLRVTLLACLADSYEDVKATAVRLLTSTPGLLDDFGVPSKALHVISRAVECAGGVKPPECLSAAYLLATVSHTTFSKPVLTAVVEKYPCCDMIANQDEIQHVSVFCLVLIAVDQLNQQLEVAKTNLLKASASGPLHGLLFTVRLLLSQINLKDRGSEPWRQLIRRLVSTSFDCSAAVASIVNNDSPEGHFPMDFDFDPSAVCVGEQEGEGVTSQMVLLCSWRTVKEVSLLLGYLAEECTIYSTQQEGLLSEDEMLRIGHHLTTLLAETKHRGAFEQAYVGFCKLVSRLWRLPASNLQQLPLQWLEDTMEEIGRNDESLCATRRSAGIPFMIQALICTQMEVQGPLSVERWVNRLLVLAECPGAPPTTHTHALNILRALFRSTQLGEAVGVCVERAFIVTIVAFSATNWMVRNSATLLLSALVTRVFGVPRSKRQDDLSWKNKMTGRIFFQRYPRLFRFFQGELEKASHSSSGLHPSLYPVLLILGRLYPSSLEGTDSNVQLTQYIPDILVCSGSNIYKTRTLAAQAMVPLMTLSHLDAVIDKIVEHNIPANLRHGLLLQVAFFVKQSDRKIDQPLFRDQAEPWIVKLTSLFEKNVSCPELEALFNVLNIFCDKYFRQVSKDVWRNVKVHTKNCLEKTKDRVAIGSCLLLPRICELLLKLAMVTASNELQSLCCQMLNEETYEVRNIVLDFLNSLCSEQSCQDNFCDFYKTVDSQIKDSCKSFIVNNLTIAQEFSKIVLGMFTNKIRHPEDKVKILISLGNWEMAVRKLLEPSSKCTGQEILNYLLDLCSSSHDEVAVSAMHCLIKFMKLKKEFNFTWNEEGITRISEIVVDVTASEKSYLFYEPLHKLLNDHFDILQNSTQVSNKLQMYKTLLELSEPSRWEEVIGGLIRSEPNTSLIATFLLGLALGHFVPLEDHSDNVGKVFDKEEVNSDYEEYILSQVCSQKLNELCASHKHIASARLDSPHRAWLTEMTGIDASSLTEFIALARLKVLDLDVENICQFLNPGYQRLRLNCLKLKSLV